MQRFLRMLKCNLFHANTVGTEWSEEEDPRTGIVTIRLVRVFCPECDRSLRLSSRARCRYCGSRMSYHQPRECW